MAHGDFHWHELATPDLETAAAFYGRILGWEVKPLEGADGAYAYILKDGKPHGGMIRMSGPGWEGVAPLWMPYIAVAHCAKAAEDVAKNGGKVRHGPITAPGVGTFIICADPAGALFTLIQPA